MPEITFTGPLRLEFQDNGTWWLLEDFRYLSPLTGEAYTVPAGTFTDLASVPRWPIAYWLTGGRATREAVVHDHLCRTGIEPRAVADAIFLEAMQRLGVEPQWRAALMYAGVVLGRPENGPITVAPSGPALSAGE